ncbi:MAG: hypothetical protein H0W08_22275 [Acidobacteria bacterium]|nr:hypothetical protein [Acidobacteriota bacterium]
MHETSTRCVRWCALTAVCAVFFAGSAAAQQSTPPLPQVDPQQLRQEVDKLRQELLALRDAYEQRLAALELRLASVSGTPPVAGAVAVPPPVTAPPQAAPVAPPTDAPVASTVPGAGGPQGALPVYGNPSAMSKIFNPDIAVIGNFLGAVGKNDIAPAPVFEMGEAEATFQAVVDPYARADFFLAFSPEGVEIEEGFLTLTSLPGGLLAKVGKIKQQVGKVNTFHAHSLPWTDRPLANVNLLGGEEGLADSGISVSRLIPNSLLFLEATGELYQGNSGVFQSHTRSDVSWVGRVRGYRDITEATNLDVGASIARGHNDAGPDFTTRVFAVDAILRYRPLQRAIYRRFIGRTELFWSDREQEDGTVPAFGMYVSGDYQFARRWFAGARYDWSERAYDATLKDKGGSLMLTFWPSEFSQVRGQYRRVNFAEGVRSNELLFQFLFSIGAHGAHVF